MSQRIFKPFSIGLFTIMPSDQPVSNHCGIPILLGKQGAFGSGEHETTASCLELIPEIKDVSRCHALDLGSGTGILSIAVARLGANVIAVELDENAALSCRKNVELNGLTDKITTVCGELASVQDTTFDLILANIYVDILLPLAEQLTSMTRIGGHLLLSGIPLQDKFDIVKCYTNLGCNLLDSRIGEDFATYLFTKPDVSPTT